MSKEIIKLAVGDELINQEQNVNNSMTNELGQKWIEEVDAAQLEKLNIGGQIEIPDPANDNNGPLPDPANDNNPLPNQANQDILAAETEFCNPIIVHVDEVAPCPEWPDGLPAWDVKLPQVTGIEKFFDPVEFRKVVSLQQQDLENILNPLSKGEEHLNEILSLFDIPTNLSELNDVLLRDECYLSLLIKMAAKADINKLSHAMERIKRAKIYFAIRDLLIKFSIGQLLKSALPTKGIRTKTEKQILAEELALSPRNRRDFPRMIWEKMVKAIQIAVKNNEPPTLKSCLAVTLKESDNFKNNLKNINRWWNKDFEGKEAKEKRDLKLEKPLEVADICSCIGVGTSKLKDLNIHLAVAFEREPRRVAWLKVVHPDCEVIQGDIMQPESQKKFIDAFKRHKCRVLSFSCPCQSSSTLNTSQKNRANAEESKIIKSVLDIVDEVKPEFLMSENVPSWLSNSPECCQDFLHKKVIGDYFKEREENQYNLNGGIYNACDYGTAENSERSLILGVRKDIGELWQFPAKEHFVKTFMDVCGDLKTLAPSERDPDDPLHFANEGLTQKEIEILIHTPTGETAWDNSADYQPINKSGSPSKALIARTYSRTCWDKPHPRITTGSGQIGSPDTIHPGRILTDGTYSDPRTLSIREVFRCIGLDDNFPLPYNQTYIPNGKTKPEPVIELQENGMFTSASEQFIRTCLGEHFCPNHVNALYSTIPLPELNKSKDGKSD